MTVRRCPAPLRAVLLLSGMLGAVSAAAQPGSGGDGQGSAVPPSPAPKGSVGVPAQNSPDKDSAASDAACKETIPKGKQRPKLQEAFPDRGKSGYVATLEVQIEHGQGENVLFAGFSPERDSPEFKALTSAHFLIPDPDGGAAYRVQTEETGESVKSTVSIPFVPLPPEPGRHTLTLPSVPIAISRASGEVIRLCTSPHDIVVEDPIANLVEPKPKENPDARRQLEHWSTLKHITYAALLALVLGALLAFVISKFLRRPKAAPPPPPPRPPWEVAMEQLFDIRNANLIEARRFDDHFDRVSDTVREYLGRRFGFDGLETTTREMLQILRAYRPSIAVLPQIEAFLRKADLVKFARQTPSELECEQSLALAEELISRTIPSPGEHRQPNSEVERAAFQSTAASPRQVPLQEPAEHGSGPEGLAGSAGDPSRSVTPEDKSR